MATALIVLISFMLLGGLSTVLSYRRTLADRRAMMLATLSETARYITAQHLHYSVDLDDLNMSMWLTMTAGVTGFDMVVTNAQGVVIFCTKRPNLSTGRVVPEYLLTAVDSGENTVMISSLGSVYQERHQVSGTPLALNVGNEMRTFGYLFVTSNVAVFEQEWHNLYSVFMITTLSVMGFAFIVLFVATKQQTKPLNEMANAARRFARGDFEIRVGQHKRQDEIGQLTEAFNAMADSLEGSEKIRREFIANLSHELKTPMTVISGFADGLLDGTIPNEEESRYLGVISSETKRLSRLVKSMQDISTLQSAKAGTVFDSSFDISEVVRLALLSLDGKIDKKQLGIEAELPEDAILTCGDADSIMQVVYNLLDNAIKFSTPGGVIGLELWTRDSKVYVSITNKGETIPADELPLIFDRFHKTDKSRSIDRDGVGLGLFIVKTILDKHNEDIFVTSSGGITKFIFSLTVAH